MGFELISFNSNIVQRQAVNEIMKCNELTKKYGLGLTEDEAIDLVNTRSVSLGLLSNKDIERIQFECLTLLRNQCESYNLGDSSSILE